jgi:protein-cysteine N-palmitoyltransferase HHAT
VVAFFALRYLYMRPITHGSTPVNNLYRLPFYLIFSLLMLGILHGTSILKVLVILSLNYALAKATAGTWLCVPVTWLFNGCVLLANEWYEGYKFANLHPGLSLLVRRKKFSLFLHLQRS